MAMKDLTCRKIIGKQQQHAIEDIILEGEVLLFSASGCHAAKQLSPYWFTRADRDTAGGSDHRILLDIFHWIINIFLVSSCAM